jgi:hypothetical protein
MRRVWVVVVLCFWLSALGGSVQALPSVTAPGRIVFVRGNSLVLWEAGQERPLHQGKDLSAPRFSADGRYVSFQQGLSYHVIDAGGAGPWALPGREPRWSPSCNLLVMDTNSGTIVLPITEQGPGTPVLTVADWHDPAWSPDGRTLALVKIERGTEPLSGMSTIGLLSLAEGQPRVRWQEAFRGRGPDTFGPAGTPRWSADGRWLSYLRYAPTSSGAMDQNQLMALPVADGAPVKLGEVVPNPAFYHWSPRGAVLAFTDGTFRAVWHNKWVRIAPMPPKPPYHSPTPAGYADREPAWDPSGKYLAVSRSLAQWPERTNRPANEQAIWVVPVASTGGHKVRGSDGGVGPTWGPDGSLLWVQPPSGDRPASLWWKPSAENGEAVQLIPEIGLQFEYYGQWRWPEVFDWWTPHG